MDGINSGSFRFSGLATGLDTAALVEAFLQLERRPLDLVEERKEGLEKQQSLFRDLNTRLLALRDAARALDNQNPRLSGPTLDEEFLAYSAASSDDGVLTGTANGNAAVGSTSIRVLSLASVARRVSTAFSSDTDPIASSGDTLSIDYGGDESIDITVGAAGASLRDLRDLVNSDPSNGGEVRAEVLFDGSAYRLIVSGGRTGAGNDVALTTTIAGEGGNSFLDVALGQDAADARLEVLGIPVTRPSNEIDDGAARRDARRRGDRGQAPNADRCLQRRARLRRRAERLRRGRGPRRTALGRRDHPRHRARGPEAGRQPVRLLRQPIRLPVADRGQLRP
jgi:flagellar hook-associated protein 2